MTLGRDRWDRLDDLFHRASSLSGPDRRTLLDRECANDLELRAELEGLLAAADSVGVSAIDAVQRSWDRAVQGPGSAMVGRRIGAYRLQREIGRGGMGVVYLGVREEGDFDQRAAIKVLPGALLAVESRWRFENERRILADLQHPRIARLLDGGETVDGLPYVIMELVDGRPIDEYCEAAGLDTAARLHLFIRVCEALSHAHSHLVVHRDLKPGNILVGDDGEPKLLDFGIAKLLGPEGYATLTHFGTRALTPAYASPEQMRGDPIGTTSDVYSLGVLLYRLLSGSLPFDTNDRSPFEIERAIAETVPPPPSFTSGRRELQGDLDTIVLKALRKDAADRYSSVELLAADLGSYLEGRPISARPRTLAYRARKFIRRNAGGVVAASLVSLLIVGFAVSTALQAARIARERDLAEAERAKASAVADFLQEVFRSNDPNEAKGVELTAGQILSRGGRLARERLEDQPEIRAEVLHTVGRLYRQLAEYDSAQTYLEEARDLRARALGQDHTDYVRSVDALGRLAHDRGDFETARALLAEVVSRREEMEGPTAPLVALALNELARVKFEAGDADTRPLFERAIAIHRASPDPDQNELTHALTGLATVLRRQGQSDSAIVVLQAVVAERRKEHGEDHLEVATAVNNLGAAYYTAGHFIEAEDLFRQSVEIRERLLGPTHPMVMVGLNNLALAESSLGQDEEAVAIYGRIIDARKERGDPPATYSKPLHNRALALSKLGRLDEAVEGYRASIEIRRIAQGERNPDVSFPLLALGDALRELGDTAGSEQAFREGLSIRLDGLGPEHRLTAEARYHLGHFLWMTGRLSEAEAEYRAALAVQRRVLDPEHRELANTLGELGRVLVERGDAEEGLPLIRDAVEMLEAIGSASAKVAELREVLQGR